jgi:hypothetical protein
MIRSDMIRVLEYIKKDMTKEMKEEIIQILEHDKIYRHGKIRVFMIRKTEEILIKEIRGIIENKITMIAIKEMINTIKGIPLKTGDINLVRERKDMVLNHNSVKDNHRAMKETEIQGMIKMNLKEDQYREITVVEIRRILIAESLQIIPVVEETIRMIMIGIQEIRTMISKIHIVEKMIGMIMIKIFVARTNVMETKEIEVTEVIATGHPVGKLKVILKTIAFNKLLINI